MPHDTLRTSGIGLRAPHVRDLLESKAPVGFVEAHTENYFGGGKLRKDICAIADIYPVSLHGVGLSLGRADGLDQDHIRQVKSLVDEINPIFVSEHLSWSGYSHTHTPDLLPIPFTNEALDIFAAHVTEFQERIGRQILVENPSNYLAFKDLDYSEPAFLNLLASRTGCGLLLDINNIAVSAHNLGYDAMSYINTIDKEHVKQFHLAGYQINTLDDGADIYIDTHGQHVSDGAWNLYAHALTQLGDIPTLIEWDTDIPALDILVKEAHKADAVRRAVRGECHAHAA